MEENLINNNEPAPVVEKVSIKTIKQEKAQEEVENNDILNNLINSALQMNEEEIKRATAYIQKKIDILKKIK